MASVAVRVDDLDRGDFPALCAKTGVPCTNAVRLTMRVRGPGLVGRLRAARRVGAIVPVVPRRTALVRRAAELSWVSLAVLVAGVGWGFARGGVGAAALAIAGLVAYVALVLAGSRLWFGAVVSPDPDVVTLTRVHPDFVRAVLAEPAAR